MVAFAAFMGGLAAQHPCALAAPTNDGEPTPRTDGARAPVIRSTALVVNGTQLGEIVLRIRPDGTALLPKAALIDMLLPVFDRDKTIIAQLERMPESSGYVTLGALRAAGFSIGLDRTQLILGRIAAPSPPALTKAAPLPAGKVSLLDTTLTSGGKHLGEFQVRVIGSSTVLVPKAALIDMLMPLIDGDKGAVARLEKMTAAEGHVTLAELKAAGFAARFSDRNRLDIALSAPPPTAGPPAAARPPTAPTHEPPAKAETPVPPEPEPQASPPAGIDSTGRLVRLKHAGEVLGQILVRAGTENSVLVPKGALIDMLTPALEKEPGSLAKLEAVPERDGQVALADVEKAGLELRFNHNQLEFGKPAKGADTAGFAKPVPARLNPTDRTISLNVPHKEGDTQLGEILVLIEPNGTVLVSKAALIQQLAPVLDKAALARLEKVPDKNGQVAIGDLSEASFRLTYDPNQLELAFIPALEQRPLSDLSVGRRHAAVPHHLAKPAIVSGYVNLFGGADHRWDGPGTTSFYLDMQSAVRIAGVVLVNEANYEGELDPQQCPTGAQCTYEHAAGFKRRRSQLVYDVPEQLLRVQIGDVEQPAASFQRANDVLGFAIEKSPRKLAPGESIRPTGRGAFSIERPAEVEVLINGSVTQRLRLKPGNYNIRDLPLTAGANEIELLITDDRGHRRTLAFSAFSDSNMLAAGKSEWALSGGMGSYFADGERAYRSGDYLANGTFRYGATDQITLEAQAKGDMFVTEGGLGVAMSTPLGAWGLHGAVSTSDFGLGYATSINWDLINVRGLFGTWREARESLRVAAEYRSTEFRTPGEYVTTATGILYPQLPYWLRLSGSYSVPIFWGATAGLAARYQFADPDQIVLSPLVVAGDRYGADVTLSSPLGNALSASVTAGYSNEHYQRMLTSLKQDESPEMRIMVRLFVRPDDKSRVSASYDSLHSSSYVSAYMGKGRSLDNWEADINLQSNEDEQRGMAYGSLAYSGNRGEVRVTHSSNFDGVEWQHASFDPKEQRSSMRVGTAIAFADGRTAIGQPVRGGAFALVYPHESLAGKEIIVGGDGNIRARSGAFGAALVPDLPAYTRNTIPVDVTDLPVGYSLGGGGVFDLIAPYRAGYALEVGSANSISAYGTLLLADFSVLGLVSGIAHPADNPLQRVVVFTNRAGRFSAEGLSPGKWLIEMATEGNPTRYAIDIPKETDGLFQAGILRPVDAD